MKKIRLLWLGVLCVTLFSCYEDKGHYDYTTREEIEIEGLEETYTRVRLLDTLRISVEPLLSEEYDCLWMLKGPNSFDFDTISHDQQLAWPVSEPQGEYRLILKLNSRTDGYSRWFESKLNITSTFSDGWLVLKDRDDRTDIDFFPTDTTRMTDILGQSIGRSLAGEARCMSLTGMGYIQHDGKIDWGGGMIYAGSSEDLWMVQIGDMSLQRDFSQLFFGEVPQGTPLNVPVNPQRSMCLSTEQGIFFQKLGSPTTGQMGEALDFGGEMEMAKSTIANGEATYFYDQKNQRFLAVNYNGTPVSFVEDGWKGATPPVKVNRTGCSLLYLGINKYDSEYFYSVMENAGGRYVYTMLAPKGMPLGTPPEDKRNLGTYNPIRTVDTLPAGLKIYEAGLFAIASTAPYIYYNDAGGNTVHFYDMLAKAEVNNVFPAIFQAGERITFMKALYHDPNPRNPVPEDTFDKFVIATEKDGHYKVYLYELLAGKPAPGREPVVLKGDGRVCSVQKIFLGWGSELSRCSVNF